MTAPRLAPGAAHTLGLAVLGGLLSSSCCVLQLALNAASLGCAGFSALTPYRPLFLAATAGGLGLAHWRSRSARQTLLALAISVGLALTPELVRTVVEGRPPALVARLWLPPGLRARAAAPAPAQPRVAALDAAAAEQPWADVEVRASGIRCAGCAARVRRAVLDALPAGAECRVEFESGRVAAGGWGVTAAAVTAAVEGLGYAVRAVAPPAHAAPEPPTVATGEL